MAPEGLRRVMQEIQVADYELHAAFRIIAQGRMHSEHIAAFMDASLRRDRMMAQVFSHVAEMRKQNAYEAITARRNGNASDQNGTHVAEVRKQNGYEATNVHRNGNASDLNGKV